MANKADPDQKPTDLDIHCLQKQGISRFSRTKVNTMKVMSSGAKSMSGSCYGQIQQMTN